MRFLLVLDNAGVSGVSGKMSLPTGKSTSGMIELETGQGVGGSGGNVEVSVGAGDFGDGGEIKVTAGSTVSDGSSGGKITLHAGQVLAVTLC